MSPLDPNQSPKPPVRSSSMQFATTLTPPPLPRRSMSLSAKRPQNEDPRFVLPACQTPGKEVLEPIEAFVSGSIATPGQKTYRSIIDCVRKRNDGHMLHRLLLVLRTNGSTLTQMMKAPNQHAELLHCIFRLDPFIVPVKMANDEPFHELVETFQLADAYLHLIVAIASANSIFLHPALAALWKLMSLGDRTELDLREGKNQRLHAAIATLIRLVPKGSSDLFPVVVSDFPFRHRPNVVAYAGECFKVLQYAPMLEPKMLELMIDKALEMDVEIKIKDGGDVEIDEEKHVKQNDDSIFELDLDDHPEVPKEESFQEKSKRRAQERIDDLAEKLDNIMLLFFRHIQDRVQNDPSAAPILFRLLLPIFESNILTTHRSKYVQFVLFFICAPFPHSNGATSTSTPGPYELHRDFASTLIESVMDPYRATVTRQSAACYLASFVSRAKYVCPETACESVAALLRWAESYLREHQVVSIGNDYRSLCDMHSLFYTVCQAAFYIMCFRGKEAVEFYHGASEYFDQYPGPPGDDCPYPTLDHVNMEASRWENVCGHRLQPLRFCLESVREEFILVAEAFALLPSSLVKNLDQEAKQQSSRPESRPKRRRGLSIVTPATLAKQRVKGGVGGLGRGNNPLDSFFPFDPYLLKESHTFVDPLYQNWEGSIEEDLEVTEHGDEDVEIEDVAAMQSEDEAEEVDRDEEESDNEDNREHMTASVESSVFLERMSFNSGASGPLASPCEHQQVQRVAWSNALKRPRAPSICENGSW